MSKETLESYAQTRSRLHLEGLSNSQRATFLENERQVMRQGSRNSCKIQHELNESRQRSLARGLLRIKSSSGFPASALTYFAPTRHDSETDSKAANILPKMGQGKVISMVEAQMKTGLNPELPIEMTEDNVIPLHPIQEQLEEFTQTGPPPAAA